MTEKPLLHKNSIFKAKTNLPIVNANANLSSLSMVKQQTYLKKYVFDNVKTQLFRTNSENELLLKLDSLNLNKIPIVKNETQAIKDGKLIGFNNAEYYNTDKFKLPSIGSKFSIENQTFEELKKQIGILSDSNSSEKSSINSSSFSFEWDLKNLLKVSMSNKRLLLLIEQYENDFKEKDNNKKRKPKFRTGLKSDLSLTLKFDHIANIKCGSFGQSSLVHLNAFKRLDKKNYFFMKKLDLPNPQTNANNNSNYRYFINNLKIFKKNETTLKSRLNRLKNELKSLSCFSLTIIFDAHLTQDLKSLYIFTEFTEKNNLDTKIRFHRIQRTFIEFDLILQWFYETMSAILYLHSNNLLHGNLKPSNFLLTQNEHLKLTGFGYLNIYNTIVNENETYLTKLCKSLSNYLPKETIERHEYTEFTDIYLVGSIFYEVLLLEQYSQTREHPKHALEVKCKDEGFVFLLSSMLNNESIKRPNAITTVNFFNWDRSVKCLKNLKTNKFCTTSLINSDKFTNLSVKKQFKITENNKPNIESLLSIIKCQLNHKNLQIFQDDYYIINNSLFLVTDYLPQKNLCDKLNTLNTNGIDESLLLQWLIQILDALNYLHSKQIIHGNLKCENIFFNELDEIKLVDFGFYHYLTCSNDNLEINYNNYLPEFDTNVNHKSLAINGAYGLSFKSDIYMLGLILFKCITLNEYNYDLNSLNKSECSEQLKNCIRKMLNKKPELRPDLNELFYELKGLLGDIHYNLLTLVPKYMELNGKIKTCLNVDDFDINDSENVLNSFLIVAVNESFKKLNNVRPAHKIMKLESVSTRLTVELVDKGYDSNSIDETSYGQRTFIKNNTEHLKIIFMQACSIKRHNTPRPANMTTQLNLKIIDKLPKLICSTNKSYLFGVDSETIYLISKSLKSIHKTSLLDSLHISNKSTLVDFSPNLKVLATCYDTNLKQLYLLTSVKDQQCFLNIFDANKPTNLTFKNIFYVPVNAKGTKKMICNEHLLIICDKKGSVRCFDKENGSYLYTLKSSTKLDSTKTKAKCYSIKKLNSIADKYEEKTNLEIVKDICMDSNGDIYVAYNYSIEVFSSNAKFKWKHQFNYNLNNMPRNSISSLSTISSYSSNINLTSLPANFNKTSINTDNYIKGKITNISIGRNGTLAIITQDDYFKFKSHCFIFSEY